MNWPQVFDATVVTSGARSTVMKTWQLPVVNVQQSNDCLIFLLTSLSTIIYEQVEGFFDRQPWV